LPAINDTCIMNLAIGHKGSISRVKTHEPERLQYFATLNLMPGVEFEIVGRAPFNGPMRLRLEHEEVVLGAELTKSIWVT
jgi:DtxR family transcriptional regulator, Mn-dependent transcriptional regulator